MCKRCMDIWGSFVPELIINWSIVSNDWIRAHVLCTNFNECFKQHDCQFSVDEKLIGPDLYFLRM